MSDRGGSPSGSQVYVGLRTRLIISFSVVFALVLGGIYLWFYNTGLPQIVERATTAFDVGASESSVALDPTTVHILRENFVRALEFQVWQNLSTAGLGLALVFFLVEFVFIFLIVTFAHRNISALTAAARQIAGGNFDIDLSHLYSGRFQSEISELARAVEASGRAHLREEKLKHEVSELKIEIDSLKRDKEVNAIVESDSFKELRQKAADLRRSSAESDAPES